jgi:hypothetical protein
MRRRGLLWLIPFLLLSAVLCRHLMWAKIVEVANNAAFSEHYALSIQLFQASEYLALLPQDHEQLSSSLYCHSTVLRQIGQNTEAETLLRRRIDLAIRYHGPASDEYLGSVIELAGMLWCPRIDASRFIPDLSDALAKSTGPKKETKRLFLMSSLVIAYYRIGDIAVSDAMEARYLQERDRVTGKSLHRPAYPYSILRMVYRKEGNAAAVAAVRLHVLENPRLMKAMYESERKRWQGDK